MSDLETTLALTPALLDVHDVHVDYGAVQAVRGVSLHVGASERVALLGANGAGKTTMLRAISGALRPASGTIAFAELRIDGLPAHEIVRHGLGHLPEGRDLFPQLSVRENLQLGYWTRRSDRAGFGPALERVMDEFPILRERSTQPAGTLSGGEQQMLGIARALMSSPQLLLVDELSLGLAPKIVEQLFGILDEVHRQGTALLIVEQFVHMALANTDRAYVLAKGEVVLEGRSAELASDRGLVASYLGAGEAERAPRKGRSR